MKTWLVLDCHYLCHRAFHTSGQLMWRGQATGVIFGFLKSVGYFKEKFQTDRVAFCFEHRHLLRRDVYPEYKQRRRKHKKRTEEEKRSYKNFIVQVCELRKRHLPRLGFKNIFCFDGYESDDIMASIAQNEEDEIILITSDQDLYQCLTPNVMIYSPHQHKMFTYKWFRREYGIRPPQWAIVKSLAGCSGDEIQGIGGVGQVTALRYVRGELDTGSVAYAKIISKQGKRTARRNLGLVELPYRGCPTPVLRKDNVSLAAWRSVCEDLGMRSLSGSPPLLLKERMKGYGKRQPI